MSRTTGYALRCNEVVLLAVLTAIGDAVRRRFSCPTDWRLVLVELGMWFVVAVLLGPGGGHQVSLTRTRRGTAWGRPSPPPREAGRRLGGPIVVFQRAAKARIDDGIRPGATLLNRSSRRPLPCYFAPASSGGPRCFAALSMDARSPR